MDLQPFIERILEVENLTDNLEDSQAKRLLDWGIGQLPVLLADLADPIGAAEKTGDLMRVMRSINRLIPDRAALSPDDLSDLAEKAAAAFPKARVSMDAGAAAAALAGLDAGQALEYLLGFVTGTPSGKTPASQTGSAPVRPEPAAPPEPPAQPKLSFFERLFGKR